MTTRRSAKVRTDLPIPPRLISTARCATCRSSPRCGATSIRSCSTGGTSGYKGNFEKDLADHNEKALALFQSMEEIKEQAAKFMKVKAVWQFFEAERDGNSIHLFAPGAASADPHLPLRPPAPRGRPVPERLHPGAGGRPARSSGDVRGDGRARGSARNPKSGRTRASIFKAHGCRRWPSKPPKAAPSGCTAASARIGASPIRPP